MDARFTVLGSCGAWPEPGRACSGFVFELNDYRIVLDLGFGTLPRLLSHLASTTAAGIDAVVVTHAHADHAADLHGLMRSRWFGDRSRPPLPLYAPRDVIEQMSRLEIDDANAVDHVFDWHPIPGEPYTLGPAQLTTMDLPHYVTNAGVRLTAPGVTLAYTGDTGPTPALAELGRGADLFVMEASDRFQQPNVPAPSSGPKLHLSSAEAADAARDARAQRLLLSHFWPGNDRDMSWATASSRFPRQVILADEGLAIDLP